jgi:hypothetical protein
MNSRPVQYNTSLVRANTSRGWRLWSSSFRNSTNWRMSKSNYSCDLQRYFMDLSSHYTLVERVKCYEDAFGSLTDKVQKLCVWSCFWKPRPFLPVYSTADLLLYHFGPTGLNNGYECSHRSSTELPLSARAAGMREGQMDSSSAANLQFEQVETEHVQRPPCATDGYSASIPSSTLQDMNADAVHSGRFVLARRSQTAVWFPMFQWTCGCHTRDGYDHRSHSPSDHSQTPTRVHNR